MNSTKVIYVTGCLGFIGSEITRQCLSKGWYVKGVDKCTYAANTKNLEEFGQSERFSFHQVDINDLEFLYDCDYVINTAAETHVGNSIVRSDEFVRSNINGVQHLLELIRLGREDHKPTFLHFSTDEVYGDIEVGAHTEKDLLKPSNPYAATKACGDMLICAWARTYGLPYIIVRPTNNYGVGQYVEKLIPKTCKYLHLGRKIPLHDEGKPIRNWLHVEDTARAIIAIIESGITNEIYNIAGHFEQSNKQTVEKIVKEYFGDHGVELKDFTQHTHRVGQDVRYAINDIKLQNLGWWPKANFCKELPKIIDYYKDRFIW
jgi:dTDP-glucose 4,6-dehydratase